jgi:hypothetical protein
MDAVNALASIPAILALVQVCKAFGVSGKWAIAAALVIGVALNVAVYLWAASGVFDAVATGLLYGLGGMGLYDVAKIAGNAITD